MRREESGKVTGTPHAAAHRALIVAPAWIGDAVMAQVYEETKAYCNEKHGGME